ncbi:MAG: thiamine phosphate synthase [Opitutaceae bacterium]|jgi:thiamine-phosphate pyrophosphorylase|nr:thiamine phosphate synthase [Opitutaceae bacterium]
MKPSFDLSLYLVTDKPENYRKPLLDAVGEAVAAGVTIVQYRADSGSRRELYETALALRQRLRPLGVPLIVNDCVDLALAVDADGAHIGQNDLPAPVARRLLGAGRLLGVSVTNAAQLAATDLSVVDYLGIGPVFTTYSKRNAAPAIGVAALAELRRRTALPVVAIGGLNAARAPEVLKTGVNGIAVVSALSQVDDIAGAVRALRAARPAA